MRKKHAVIAVAVLVVVFAAVYVIRRMPSISPPAEYANANVRVDVVLQEKGRPLAHTVIKSAEIWCLFADYPSMPWWWPKKYWYEEWCDNSRPSKTALNLPTQTNEKGEMTLWFDLDPAPQSVLLHDPDVSIGLEMPDGTLKAFNAKIVRPDHWLVTHENWPL